MIRKILKNFKVFCFVVIFIIMIRCKFVGLYENYEGIFDKIIFWFFYVLILRSFYKYVLFIG